jgi:hypothetical protein
MSNSYLVIKGVKIELTPEQIEILQPKEEVKKVKWTDFDKIEGYYISEDSEIIEYNNNESKDGNKNTFPSKEEAEASIALSQLCQWRDKYNEGWKANWYNYTNKYCIYFYKNEADVNLYESRNTVLSFKSAEIRDKFLNDFKNLIEIAMPLL